MAIELNNEKRENQILNLTFAFAVKIIDISELLENHRKFVLSNQILKSGTSIGANVREAQNSESKKDFIHKMKIAAKEADETEYWLLLCQSTSKIIDFSILLDDLTAIKKILSKIISTTKSSISTH